MAAGWSADGLLITIPTTISPITLVRHGSRLVRLSVDLRKRTQMNLSDRDADG